MTPCNRFGCPNTLDHLTSRGRYCSTTCRREAARSRAFSRDGAASPWFWTRYRQIRRRRPEKVRTESDVA